MVSNHGIPGVFYYRIQIFFRSSSIPSSQENFGRMPCAFLEAAIFSQNFFCRYYPFPLIIIILFANYVYNFLISILSNYNPCSLNFHRSALTNSGSSAPYGAQMCRDNLHSK